MSELRFPKEGDFVRCGEDIGKVLDDDFIQVQWQDGTIEEWNGAWGSFVKLGGKYEDSEV